jgi:hypothetical protein
MPLSALRTPHPPLLLAAVVAALCAAAAAYATSKKLVRGRTLFLLFSWFSSSLREFIVAPVVLLQSRWPWIRGS